MFARPATRAPCRRTISRRVRELWRGRAGPILLPLLLLGQAPTPPIPPSTAEGGEVVVTARTRAAVDQLVLAMTQTERGKQLARWNDAVCPRALGLDPAQAAYVAKRVGAIARQAKVRVGGDRCHANIVIVFTGDPDGFSNELVRRHPGLFADPDNGLASPSQRARLLQPRPIRWLAASRTKGPNGVPIAGRMNPIYAASRLVRTTQEDSAFTLIIVDVASLGSLAWGQLSAYLAMVALARPDMDASFGGETILSLFDRQKSGTALPPDITRDDLDLLTALYATTPGLSAKAQRGDIGRFLRRRASSVPIRK